MRGETPYYEPIQEHEQRRQEAAGKIGEVYGLLDRDKDKAAWALLQAAQMALIEYRASSIAGPPW